MSHDAGLDIDFDSQAESQALALQRATDPELGKEAVPASGTVTLAGRSFRISSKVGLMPLLKFAHAANSGLDTGDMRSFDALYEILQDVIQEPVPPCGECVDCQRREADAGYGTDCPFADAGDWDAFERHAVSSKADAEELLDTVSEAITQITARPTGSPSASSAGRRPTSRNSTAASSGRGAGSNGSRRARRAT
jgi:hypothetical protein